MINPSALASFGVDLRQEDSRVLVLTVTVEGEHLATSRLTLTATQLASPPQRRALIRREVIRLLGEVGSMLDFSTDLGAQGVRHYSDRAK